MTRAPKWTESNVRSSTQDPNTTTASHPGSASIRLQRSVIYEANHFGAAMSGQFSSITERWDRPCHGPPDILRQRPNVGSDATPYRANLRKTPNVGVFIIIFRWLHALPVHFAMLGPQSECAATGFQSWKSRCHRSCVIHRTLEYPGSFPAPWRPSSNECGLYRGFHAWNPCSVLRQRPNVGTFSFDLCTLRETCALVPSVESRVVLRNRPNVRALWFDYMALRGS